jgi:hypothetical protein
VPVHGNVFEQEFLMLINAYFSFFFRTVDVCQSGRIRIVDERLRDQWMYASQGE